MDNSKNTLSNDDIALICEFRAMPFSPSFLRKKETKGKAVEFSTLCDALFKRHKIGETTPQQVILENWKSIIYGDFYKHAYPLKVSANILYIKTANPAIRQHLSFDKSEIIKNIQNLHLCQNIDSIRFI